MCIICNGHEIKTDILYVQKCDYITEIPNIYGLKYLYHHVNH